MHNTIFSLPVISLLFAAAILGFTAESLAESGLSQKKIYFGHMSIGNNIIQGIESIMKADPSLRLNIIQIGYPSRISSAQFAHSPIGKNGDPISKIDSFKRMIEGGLGRDVDIAFFKFCYIDIGKNTDIQAVFSHYKKVMDQLSKDYPRVKFIHVTCPLRVVQTGWKAMIKKTINRPAGGYEDNIRRNEYNELLRMRYGESGKVFDLAEIESTGMDGSRSVFTTAGRSYFSLVPDYTRDGKHLNDTGQRIVAGKLLTYLAAMK